MSVSYYYDGWHCTECGSWGQDDIWHRNDCSLYASWKLDQLDERMYSIEESLKEILEDLSTDS